jgi:hypothetical protein
MKTIAVALTMITVALTLAAPATADDDTDFLQVLNDEGIRYGSSGDAIRQAHVVCQLFDERDSFATVQEALQQANRKFSRDDASYFIGASVGVYCPYDKAWVHSSLG